MGTSHAEGEALRRLIERWRKQAIHERGWSGPKGFGGQAIAKGIAGIFDNCADDLEAALAPLSGPVDASGEPECPECGYFIGHKDFCTVGRRRAAFCPNCKRTQPTDGVRVTFQCSYCGFRLPDNADLPAAAAVPSSPVADSPTWQPMATLLEGFDHIIAAWRDGCQDETGEVLLVGGNWLCLMTDCYVTPTHWMPLPSAPSPSAGAAKDKD